MMKEQFLCFWVVLSLLVTLVMVPVISFAQTPTPTPTEEDWYSTYGPDGTGQVIHISSMYVASQGWDTGCDVYNQTNWAAAVAWGDDLSWLGESDWYLPTKDQLSVICANKDDLGS